MELKKVQEEKSGLTQKTWKDLKLTNVLVDLQSLLNERDINKLYQNLNMIQLELTLGATSSGFELFFRHLITV